MALICALSPELASRVGRLAGLTDTAVPLLFPWGTPRGALCTYVHWAACEQVRLKKTIHERNFIASRSAQFALRPYPTAPPRSATPGKSWQI